MVSTTSKIIAFGALKPHYLGPWTLRGREAGIPSIVDLGFRV